MASQHRDQRTGRYARRPVQDVDAESRFDPVGDSIEDIRDVSGAPSPNTIEQPSFAPEADTLAGAGPNLGDASRGRPPVTVDSREEISDYGSAQGARTRAAARQAGLGGNTAWIMGLDQGR